MRPPKLPYLRRLHACAAVLLAALLHALPAEPAQRSTTDRPDDSALPQVHVLYVVPSDGVDHGLDVDGTLSVSVAAIERWFAERSGGRRLRFDTHQNVLDVTFHRLARSDAELSAAGIFLRDEIEDDLNAAGFNAANKVYAVYYDGSSTAACGGAFWPPTLPGNVVAVYLKGSPPGFPPCAANPFAPDESSPRYWEFAMLHEILHGFGVVATCAPHHTLAGHVSDDPRDLMYAGPLPWNPSLLDLGLDDYFEHSLPACLDLADSDFLVGPGECEPNALTHCLLEGRFRVALEWRTATGETGAGRAVPLTDRAGLFYFFHQDNLEVLFKVLDGCLVNGHFWAFYAATTNVEFTLTVEDTLRRREKTYFNPLGSPAAPIADTAAFDTCPQ